MPKRPEILLWLSDARGVYIPRDFANSFSDRAKAVEGVSAEEWNVLELGPYHEGEDEAGRPDFNESYWDVWADVEQNAIVTDSGVRFTIYNDGDCWLVPVGMEWDDDVETFIWPDERETEEEVDD